MSLEVTASHEVDLGELLQADARDLRNRNVQMSRRPIGDCRVVVGSLEEHGSVGQGPTGVLRKRELELSRRMTWNTSRLGGNVLGTGRCTTVLVETGGDIVRRSSLLAAATRKHERECDDEPD